MSMHPVQFSARYCSEARCKVSNFLCQSRFMQCVSCFPLRVCRLSIQFWFRHRSERGAQAELSAAGSGCAACGGTTAQDARRTPVLLDHRQVRGDHWMLLMPASLSLSSNPSHCAFQRGPTGSRGQGDACCSHSICERLG